MGLRNRKYLDEAITVDGIMDTGERLLDKAKKLIRRAEGSVHVSERLRKALEAHASQALRLAKSIKKPSGWQKITGY
jgi:hypothetical protein